MSKPVYDVKDSGENRLWGALGYLFFFLPLLIRPSSKFYRFCANQGLLLWLVKLAVTIVFGILGWLLGWVPVVGWIITHAGRPIDLIIHLAMIYYGFRAFSGRPERLPVIGGFELIR